MFSSHIWKVVTKVYALEVLLSSCSTIFIWLNSDIILSLPIYTVIMPPSALDRLGKLKSSSLRPWAELYRFLLLWCSWITLREYMHSLIVWFWFNSLLEHSVPYAIWAAQWYHWTGFTLWRVGVCSRRRHDRHALLGMCYKCTSFTALSSAILPEKIFQLSWSIMLLSFICIDDAKHASSRRWHCACKEC